MRTLIFEMLNGKSKEFKLSQLDIEKIIMALENVQTKWFAIGEFRVRPEHIVSIQVD